MQVFEFFLYWAARMEEVCDALLVNHIAYCFPCVFHHISIISAPLKKTLTRRAASGKGQ